jgi:hypothetical protein
MYVPGETTDAKWFCRVHLNEYRLEGVADPMKAMAEDPTEDINSQGSGLTLIISCRLQRYHPIFPNICFLS